ncbi:Ig-like domain-containing protein [Mangrovibacterium diazotrophicum]|uniref:Ig-like domain-containing protein n=1 Tax=Mangrovibacterium diazotrophicum TaxID=1261403 RepID=A0A419VYG7_9BACT|nr:Ig-like domain-containing protein [Mangrovibacterium diazotrophicum]RKD88256.1 Ig-like domain-containing protein [Mangrovibacterium diazotrophicum]
MKKSNLKYWLGGVALVGLTSYSLVSCQEDYDHTVDASNPTVVSFNPVSGVEDVAVKSNLVLTFDEYIQKGEGDIVIACEVDTQTIAVTSSAVQIGDDGRVLTIDPEDLSANETYVVTLERGFVTDLVGNEFLGLGAGQSWTFVTAGESGPTVASLSPEDDSEDASLFELAVTFSAKVAKGEGNITIYSAGGTVVEEFSVASSSIVVDNETVTISLSEPFEFATAYYVTIDAGSFVDADSKPFKGFTNDTSWNFTTTSGSGSDLVVYLPMDADLADASGNHFDAVLGEDATAEVTFVTDATRGQVAMFNAGSYAVLPKHDLLRPALSQDFSFNIWLKLEGIGSDPAIFSNKDWDSGGNPGVLLCTNGADSYVPGGSGTGWQVNIAGDPKADGNRMDWKAGKTTPQAPALSDNEWHMVSVVFDQTNKLLHVYIDAVEYTQPENTASFDLNTLTGPIWDNTNDYPFTIWEDGTGHYNSGSDTRKNLEGMVDELRFYNKALSATEISDLFNN